MTDQERAVIVAKAMRSVWSSLESHLDWANNPESKPPEDGEFHRTCVVEYAELLTDLAKLY